MIAVCATCYRLPPALLTRYIADNFDNSLQVHLFICSDLDYSAFTSVHFIPYTGDTNKMFNISLASNALIHAAIDAGANKIIKTDIDCYADWQAVAAECEPGRGAAFRYWQHKLDKKPYLDSRIMGTIALHAADWARVQYDDRMEGYGYDDAYVYHKAARAGVKVNLKKNPKVFHHFHEAKHNRTTINPLNRVNNLKIR